MCKRSPEETERIINETLEDLGLEKYKVSTSKNGTSIMWVKEKLNPFKQIITVKEHRLSLLSQIEQDLETNEDHYGKIYSEYLQQLNNDELNKLKTIMRPLWA